MYILYRYVDTFVRTQDVKPEDVTGNIDLRMIDDQLAIDVLPLITLGYSPLFRVSYKITAGPANGCAILNTLMDVKNNPTWASRMNRAVNHVLVRASGS
jgi:hypothetical protein